MLAAARGTHTTQADRALEELCRAYWYPLYAFIRRSGHDHPTAEDLTQAFFARLLAKHFLAAVERGKGRFRSFLHAALKLFLPNEWDTVRAQKRGGAAQNFTTLDPQIAETRYAREPADPQTAEKIFERNWALTLLDEVLKRLRQTYAAEGKAELFDRLKGTLTRERGATPYAELARNLGLNEGAVKVAVHRLRRRYRDALHAEIAHTVAKPEDVDDEVRHLFAGLSG